MDENQLTAQDDNNKNLLVIGVVVLIAVAALIFALTRNGSDEGTVEGVNIQQPDTNEIIFEEPQGTQTLPETSEMVEETEATINEIQVEASDFTFSTQEIRVRQGDTVKLTLVNVDGVHDFVIDELGVRTPMLQEGETAEVEFVVDTPGTYEYYCSVGNHRAMGMVGTLIVE